MRSNLLSLQNTQSLMDMTQERLSTGKKVNSAIDNPSSYYASQSLTNRASDLNALLDSMGQAIQTIKAANEGIESITAFAEQAKAIANSARDIPSNHDKYSITSEKVSEAGLAEDDIIIVDSRKDMSTFEMTFGTGDASKKFKVYVDGTEHEITLDAGSNTAATAAADVTAQLQALGLVVEPGDAAGKINVRSKDGSDIYWLNDGAAGVTTATTAAKSVELEAADIVNSATLAAKLTASLGATATVEVNGDQISIMSTDNEFFGTVSGNDKFIVR